MIHNSNSESTCILQESWGTHTKTHFAYRSMHGILWVRTEPPQRLALSATAGMFTAPCTSQKVSEFTVYAQQFTLAVWAVQLLCCYSKTYFWARKSKCTKCFQSIVLACLLCVYKPIHANTYTVLTNIYCIYICMYVHVLCMCHVHSHTQQRHEWQPLTDAGEVKRILLGTTLGWGN